jgi:hypothetical protein
VTAARAGQRKAPIRLGAEWWAEPLQQPADPGSADIYDVDVQVVAQWQQARKDYLAARAALVGEIERQGWRAPERSDVVLHAVVEAGPWGYDSSYGHVCRWCMASDGDDHEADCLWPRIAAAARAR